ncbi:MAG: hypothetical protein JNK87_25525 [Bryobacterales bacterium]|nr:hypothetical protein [Bryobacterales bacterium]
MANFWDDVNKVAGAAAGVAVGVATGGALGVPGAVAAVGGALAGTSDPAQDAIRAAEKALVTASKVGADIAVGIGEVIITVTETAIEIVKSLIPGAIGIRPLRPSEAALADRVFKGSVQLHRIRIVSIYGAGGRPFTIPGSMIGTLGWRVPVIGPLLAWSSILSGLSNQYLVFMGDDGYRDTINYKLGGADFPGQTLVHELVHVWQGHRRLFAWEYVLDSLWNQCKCGISGKGPDAAYAFTPGKQWSEYTAEQQAAIVEAWYVGTEGAMNLTLRTDLLPYIETNIRPGSLDAQSSKLSVVTSGLTKLLPNRPTAPTMSQLLDVLDALRIKRLALSAYGRNLAVMAELSVLDAQIVQYRAIVSAMVAQGHLIEDRAKFAINMGQGPRLSSNAPVNRIKL